MADLSRAIRVGVNTVKLTDCPLDRYEPAESPDGRVLVQIGTEFYDFRIGVDMALAVLQLAAERPDLLAQNDRCRAPLLRSA